MEIRRSVWVKYNLFPALYSFSLSKNLGWATLQPPVLPAFGIFQQDREWDDSCRLARQRQAGWETLRMNSTRVWNSGTRRDPSWEKSPRHDGCEDLAEDFMHLCSKPLAWEARLSCFDNNTWKLMWKSSPHPRVTALLQEGQLNSPVHHSGSSGADNCKVDLRVSF